MKITINITKSDDYEIQGAWELLEDDNRTYVNLEESSVNEYDIADLIKSKLLEKFESIDSVQVFDESGNSIHENSTARGDFLAYQY